MGVRARAWRLGVLVAALACALVFVMPGGAVTGGTPISPAPSWAAYVVLSQKHSTGECSGSLVGSSWVLTAAHCVAPTTEGPCEFEQPYPAKDFTVYLGRTSNKNKGTSYKVSSISLNNDTSTPEDGQCVLENDVALLHLSKATTRSPLWIAPSQAAVTDGTNAVLYGYGLTDLNNSNSVGSLNRTINGDWTIDTRCDLASLINATCLDDQNPAGSAGRAGDSGGPWTMAVDSNLVQALVFTGYDESQGFAYGTGVAQTSTGAWLHSMLGIPNVAPGNIVRNPSNGQSWLIDPQGYRRPIPDGGTYLCLTGKGAQVFNLTASTLQLMAARTISATCATGNNNVLIAGLGDETASSTEPNDNLAALLTSAGYQVTESPTLPSDLSSFGQVWWVDTNPPSSAEQDQLVAFEESGGGLYLTGERPCCEALNAVDTSMINSMVVGGGVTAGGQGDIGASPYPVNPSVIGNLAQSPFVVTDWTPADPGGMLGVSDSSVFAYYQPGDITTRQVVAAAWDRSSLVGSGRLVVFMDVNWPQVAYRDPNWSDVAQNVALFLSGMSGPPGPVVPENTALLNSPLAPLVTTHPSLTVSAP